MLCMIFLGIASFPITNVYLSGIIIIVDMLSSPQFAVPFAAFWTAFSWKPEPKKLPLLFWISFYQWTIRCTSCSSSS